MADNQFSFGFFDKNLCEEKKEDVDDKVVKTSKLPAKKLLLDNISGEDYQTIALQTPQGVRFLVVDQFSCSNALEIGCDSDLEPGVYEGGLKVWECSIDLVDYLHCSGITFCEEDAVLEVYKMICKHLIRPRGVALVSSKRYYFGTGGSTQQFLNLIEQNPELTGEKVWISEDGKSNIREIVKVSWVQ
mmetsp:Transcript_6700/g.9066  ORF Transcript_6700/g.9066 Transcript_6700/m.9066 type:complete len:188 (+) Transcript_6700:159-722(+)